MWPLFVATEFRPSVLLQSSSLETGGRFVASFFPLALDKDFLSLLARETWRTVAMATAGVTLAFILAVPASLLTNRALSISDLSGRMARVPSMVRLFMRALLVLLRGSQRPTA